MMKNTKVFSMTLAVAIAAGGFTGCTVQRSEPSQEAGVEQSQTSKPQGVDENSTKEQAIQQGPIRLLTSVVGGKDPDENKLFEEEVEKLTGIKIELIKPPGSEYNEKLITTLASGEVVDLMYMGTSLMEQLLPQGLFEPLTDRIYSSSVLADPTIIASDEWERITREDGEIYGVFNKFEGGTLPSIRWDWMEKLNLKAPTTLDEYYEVLKAFTTQDPDENGLDDTYGLTLSKLYDIQPFMGVYGLINKHAQDEQGNWYIPYATEEAIPVYEWLAKLFQEGILDPNFATNGTGNCRELIFSDKAGMMVYWAAWVGMFNEQARAEQPDTAFEIRGIEPPKGENGQAILMAGEDGLWAMHKDSKNKDAAFRFLEFWHTQEGNILGTLGIEGHDYTVEGNKYILTSIGEQHAMDHGAPYPKSLQWKNPVKEMMNVASSNEILTKYAKIQISRADTNEAMEIVDKYGIKAIMGEITAADAVAEMQKELKAKGHID